MQFRLHQEPQITFFKYTMRRHTNFGSCTEIRGFRGTTIPKDVAAFMASKLGEDVVYIVSTLTGAFLLRE